MRSPRQQQHSKQIILCLLYLALFSPLDNGGVVMGFSNARIASSHNKAVTEPTRPHQSNTSPTAPTSRLNAIIYGWDDYNEEDGSDTASKPMKPIALDTTSSTLPFLSRDACDAQGAAVAEELTTQKLDSLARLAFRFRPSEHAGLKLEDIQQVQVVCVTAKEIQMEAILCESMGCVSLHIPVSFPTKCSAKSEFQTCVLNNIQALDDNGSVVVQQQSDNNIDDLLSQPLSTPPKWWKEATTDELQQECSLLQDILTEDLEEFNTELIALAKEGLEEQDKDFVFTHAKCVTVGPAGMGLKAVGRHQNNAPTHTQFSMDVWFRFFNSSANASSSLSLAPISTPAELRAAVLGAVASAAAL